MNQEKIAKLRELAAKATARPWSFFDAYNIVALPGWVGTRRLGTDFDDVIKASRYGYDELNVQEQDAAYIVAACNALPSLLDEIERLQAELDKAKEAERWIPVSERLPERNTEILFWVRPNKIGFMVFGQLVDNKYNHDVWMAIAQSASKNYKYPAVEDTYSADEVTHWKYRAAPPKEDE